MTTMVSESAVAAMRTEHDLLGERGVPAKALFGIHTVRAMENFPLLGQPVHRELIHAFGTVKLACAIANRETGAWAGDAAKSDAIVAACREMEAGLLDDAMVTDGMQGGAEPARI